MIDFPAQIYVELLGEVYSTPLFLIGAVSKLLPKDLLTLSTHFQGEMRGKGLAGRFRWLLETMMRLQGIDEEELDGNLDYWENKVEIESRFMTALVLKPDKLEEKVLRPRGKCVSWQILEDSCE